MAIFKTYRISHLDSSNVEFIDWLLLKILVCSNYRLT